MPIFEDFPRLQWRHAYFYAMLIGMVWHRRQHFEAGKGPQKKVSGSKIEYFNRLVGVILGLSMLFTFYKSF